MSAWVASMVISGPTIPIRILTIRYFLHVAQECLTLSNFNGCLEVVSGLTNAAVQRLLQTFDQLPQSAAKVLETLREAVTFQHNYRKLRELMSAVTGPGIPYLGVYMGDLLYIEDGNPDETSDGLINFEKHEMVAKIILAFERFKLHRYILTPIPLIQHYLNWPFAMNDEELSAASTELKNQEESNAQKSKTEKSGKM